MSARPTTASGSAITISSKPCATAKLSDLAAVHSSRCAHLDIQRATCLSTAGSAKVAVTFEFCRSL
jgi:hypothetical protein